MYVYADEGFLQRFIIPYHIVVFILFYQWFDTWLYLLCMCLHDLIGSCWVLTYWNFLLLIAVSWTNTVDTSENDGDSPSILVMCFKFTAILTVSRFPDLLEVRLDPQMYAFETVLVVSGLVPLLQSLLVQPMSEHWRVTAFLTGDSTPTWRCHTGSWLSRVIHCTYSYLLFRLQTLWTVQSDIIVDVKDQEFVMASVLLVTELIIRGERVEFIYLFITKIVHEVQTQGNADEKTDEHKDI